MVSGRPPDDAPDPSARRRRGGPSHEDGLRALGSQIEGTAGRGTVANEQGLRALGEQVDQGRGNGRRGRGGRKRWSTRRKILTPVIALVVLALLLVGGAYGYARYRYDQINKVHVAAEEQAISGQPFNVLVIGSDSRLGNKKGTTQYGTSTQVGGQRSDVDMIWHIVPSTRQITIVSIPRDTLVSMVGKNVTTFGQMNRINSAYNSGPTLLVQTIQDNFGIPINHVVQVDFSGFKGAVSALGGVYMDFEYPTRTTNAGTNESGLDVTSSGCQRLTGPEALAVARSRHYQYYATGEWHTTPAGDLGRIKRQDAFLKALIDSAKSKYNPLTLNAFLGSIPQGIVIDTHLSLSDMIGLAEDFHSINPTTIKTLTLPTMTHGFVTPWGDVLFVDQPAAQQMLVSVFGSQLTTPTSPPPNTALVPTQPPDVSGSTASSSAPSTAAAAAPSTSTTTPTTSPPPPPTYDPKACQPG
jgi:LCP family protein required for cell wall assembly